MEAPNLNRLSQAFGIVSEECLKFNNIPAFNQGTEIRNAFEQLTGRVDGLTGLVGVLTDRVDGLTGLVGVLTDRVDGLTGRVGVLTSRIEELQIQIQQQMQQMQRMQTQMEDSLQRIDQKFGSLEARIIAL
ncbi:hypothetical protein OCU04_000830 [Sclerotinia nivalis]|uniref:Uncharacterized protein n=1 Tax=Sclerotinia nivalis TaxID=352851 RepID=A0A9X0DNT4_9HELO|nr:hypothetical protein OCU04_000830 [Sclerotinia nivalis]